MTEVSEGRAAAIRDARLRAGLTLREIVRVYRVTHEQAVAICGGAQ
jgi:hypothetical protein